MLMCTRRTLLAGVGSAGATTLSRPEQAAAATSRSYHERVLTKRPVAYWRFEEQAGPTARDSTGNGHGGQYQGRVSFGQAGAIRSEHDVAIGLNGSDACVRVPDNVVFSQPTSHKGLSVEVWFRPDVLTFTGENAEHYVHWLGKGQVNEFEWGFRFYSKDSSRPNRVSAYIWNNKGERDRPNEGAGAYFQDDLEPGKWIHVVACYDPGDAGNPQAGVTIYKNGEYREGPASSPGARYAGFNIHPQHGSAPVMLGTRDGGSFLAGGLDEIAVYPRVLSAGEIKDNYAGA